MRSCCVNCKAMQFLNFKTRERGRESERDVLAAPAPSTPTTPPLTTRHATAASLSAYRVLPPSRMGDVVRDIFIVFVFLILAISYIAYRVIKYLKRYVLNETCYLYTIITFRPYLKKYIPLQTNIYGD